MISNTDLAEEIGKAGGGVKRKQSLTMFHVKQGLCEIFTAQVQLEPKAALWLKSGDMA